MTKEELVRFISNNYADGEELAWQTISQGDLRATDEDWAKFMEHIDRNSRLADILSREIEDYYDSWLDEQEDTDEDD